jgi:hypothetical protein
MRSFILLLLFIALFLAKEEVTYPTADTAVRNGVEYKIKHRADIYDLIDRAKDNR